MNKFDENLYTSQLQMMVKFSLTNKKREMIKNYNIPEYTKYNIHIDNKNDNLKMQLKNL
jgi:hypothetical protein